MIFSLALQILMFHINPPLILSPISHAMCYYDYMRFICGCKKWGALRRRCGGADEMAKQPDGGTCIVRRVHRHIYSSHGKNCVECSMQGSFPQPIEQQFLLPWDEFRARHWEAAGCHALGCTLDPMHDQEHFPPNQPWEYCPMTSEQAARWERKVLDIAALFRQLNSMSNDRMVMRLAQENRQKWQSADRQHTNLQQISKESNRTRNMSQEFPEPHTLTEQYEDPYAPLARDQKQIRLFLLYPKEHKVEEGHGSFLTFTMADHPDYTALSYTWGDPVDLHDLVIALVSNRRILRIRKNLWDFLQQQRSVIPQPKYFWIDAICINQVDIQERNHQVSLMKDIYVNAHDVCIWLGHEQDNSDTAMDFLSKKGSRGLRPRGPGYYPIWSREEGKALVQLYERPYWRRMWIIQEMAHAEQITLWCGSKCVDWKVIEQLYLTLKTFEDETWWAHHKYAMGVLQSAAAAMAWQRAHWRHAETSPPTLRTLIETFRHWQCGDIRDKVFALMSMASKETAIVPDYSMTPRDIYYAVLEKHPSYKAGFENILS